ncbi:MAG: GDSL-type esterase/lipase family protein, partial [Terriglobia bacterium]
MAIGTEGSDGTADYAFLTAMAFGALHNQVGFGRQGIIRTGNGDVPPASQSFGWNFQGSRADPSFIPQVVVVNQGTNDGAYPPEQFEPAYRAYIEEIRKAYPQAAIFCMRPFGGFHEKDIRKAVSSLADAKIFYVDTTSWLAASDYTDGIHPTAAGHLKAAQKLIRVISARTGLKPVRKVDKPWWQ